MVKMPVSLLIKSWTFI